MNHKHIHHSAGEHGGSGEPHAHVAPLSMYIGVFGALIVLTIVTVGISELGIPQPWSLIIAMMVAVTKASLVVTFFMHLLWDKRLNTAVFLGGIFFVLVFFSLTLVDLLSRGLVEPMNDPKVMRMEKQAQYNKCLETGTWATCKDKLPSGWREVDPNYDPNAGHGADAGHGSGVGEHGAAPAAGHEAAPAAGHEAAPAAGHEAAPAAGHEAAPEAGSEAAPAAGHEAAPAAGSH